MYDYAKKMNISTEDLKQWLKEDRGEALFGKIELSEVARAPVVRQVKLRAPRWREQFYNQMQYNI